MTRGMAAVQGESAADYDPDHGSEERGTSPAVDSPAQQQVGGVGLQGLHSPASEPSGLDDVDTAEAEDYVDVEPRLGRPKGRTPRKPPAPPPPPRDKEISLADILKSDSGEEEEIDTKMLHDAQGFVLTVAHILNGKYTPCRALSDLVMRGDGEGQDSAMLVKFMKTSMDKIISQRAKLLARKGNLVSSLVDQSAVLCAWDSYVTTALVGTDDERAQMGMFPQQISVSQVTDGLFQQLTDGEKLNRHDSRWVTLRGKLGPRIHRVMNYIHLQTQAVCFHVNEVAIFLVQQAPMVDTASVTMLRQRQDSLFPIELWKLAAELSTVETTYDQAKELYFTTAKMLEEGEPEKALKFILDTELSHPAKSLLIEMLIGRFQSADSQRKEGFIEMIEAVRRTPGECYTRVRQFIAAEAKLGGFVKHKSKHTRDGEPRRGRREETRSQSPSSLSGASGAGSGTRSQGSSGKNNTRVCVRFLNNECWWGKRCDWSHDKEAIQAKIDSGEIMACVKCGRAYITRSRKVCDNCDGDLVPKRDLDDK